MNLVCRRTAAIALAWALAAAFGAPTLQVVRPAWAAPEEPPVSTDPLRDAKKLRDEAKELFKTAGDTSLESSERGKSRKECFKKLKAARELLDQWVKANPGKEESIDPLYVDIATMMFWLKKEMTLGEINDVMGKGPAPSGSAPGGPAPGGPAPGGPAPGPGGGGIGGSRERPPTGGSPGTGEPPKGPDTPTPPAAPEPPKGPQPSDVLAEIEAYAREHPGDVPGTAERYEAFLTQFPDSKTPEFAKAVEARRTLEERMKDVYRGARDDDPESIRTEDEAEAGRRMKDLLADLASQDAVVRARAAKFLGFLGLPQAVQPILDAMRGEDQEPVLQSAAQALADLGSRKTFDRMTQAAKKDARLQTVVADALGRALTKGGPNGRLAGEMLAAFVETAEMGEERQLALLAVIANSGAPGAVGLARAAATWAPADQKADLIAKAGSHKEPKSVPWLTRFLVVNPSGARRDQAAAAREAIEAIGKPAVRHLIPALDDPDTQVWTAQLLQRITGTKQKDDKRKTWEAWFRKNRRLMEM